MRVGENKQEGCGRGVTSFPLEDFMVCVVIYISSNFMKFRFNELIFFFGFIFEHTSHLLGNWGVWATSMPIRYFSLSISVRVLSSLYWIMMSIHFWEQNSEICSQKSKNLLLQKEKHTPLIISTNAPQKL